MMKATAATRTENGAPSLTSTSSARLDLFFGGLIREAPATKLRGQVRFSWNESAEDTMALLMHARDARKGKGERKVIKNCLLWLRKHKPKTFLLNLRTFVDLGYFKDLSQLALAAHKRKLSLLGTGELAELELFAKVIQGDMDLIERDEKDQEEGGSKENTDETEMKEGGAADEENESDAGKRKKRKLVSISLAAKWAPTEGTSFDKKAKLASRLAVLLFPGVKAPLRSYRKAISKLREHLKVVERSMCAGDWSAINFSSVPSKAHKNLKGAFKKHQEERYGQYLEDLAEGKKGVKINTAGLQPHELIREYMDRGKEEDPTNEAQWTTLVEELRSAGTFGSALAVVDVSGSMSGIPIEVAIAMGLIVAELSMEPFKGKLLTFDANPRWHNVRGGSLKEQVDDVRSMPWGMNTDIGKVFDLILAEAKKSRVGPSGMPKTLYIFSDMQFDAAATGAGQYTTTHARASAQFSNAGFDLPQIVYWNLRGDTADFPSNANTPGMAMVSGFSAQLFKLFMAGGELSPVLLMKEAIKPYTGLVKIDERERGSVGGEEEDGEESDKDLDSDVENEVIVKRRKRNGGRGGAQGRGRGGRRIMKKVT